MRILYFFFSILLIGCKGSILDDAVISEDVKYIRNSQMNAYNNQDFTIIYDDKGNVHAINDTVYTYGNNGKISSSRYSSMEETNGYKHEKDIRKSYQWDAQGRILEIYVEKQLQKIIAPDGGFLENNPVGYTEAYFSYTGNNILPDSISLGKGLKAIKIFQYRNGNLSKEEQMEEYISVIGDDTKVQNYIAMREMYLYDEVVKNYLYPLFTKMGVLPKGLGYFASKHAPYFYETTTYYFHTAFPGHAGELKESYNSKANVAYTIGTNGYPTQVKYNIVLGQYEGFVTSNYLLNIYY